MCNSCLDFGWYLYFVRFWGFLLSLNANGHLQLKIIEKLVLSLISSEWFGGLTHTYMKQSWLTHLRFKLLFWHMACYKCRLLTYLLTLWGVTDDVMFIETFLSLCKVCIWVIVVLFVLGYRIPVTVEVWWFF